jgi:hypothetical protein
MLAARASQKAAARADVQDAIDLGFFNGISQN